ncbi:hypothetical protein CYME_CMJ265C [Cyanidioschyzon merolae strain 10D]|jgi:hypothetical protein|uniref:GOLD domain-containing protein n=1 Tax=Cyanidioschyzon merolae (strain NIES-3377 / 10D) TaxID=280699 RepID=M1V5B3_CYAM1|nr:hypothetical protein CYME_CMJ265C [Cyanidioschyzon merolae strain 10D]BAM80370.1 hypothetical protein CYME_CMJ265C [Cyanidioschyzon merolae strain 10D]|eukprot:XP_005534977.1 hypothetical protein CYME_CMJ265C [Cyanidioschyzon merolae strain 10D]
MRRSRLVLVCCAFQLLFLIAAGCRAYLVELSEASPECFYEDVLEGDSLVGSFLVTTSDKKPVSVRVISHRGVPLFETSEPEGRFDIRVAEAGTYAFCLSRIEESSASVVLLRFEWQSVFSGLGERTNSERSLKELEAAAKQEHLEHMMNEIQSLYRAVLHIRSKQSLSWWLRQQDLSIQRRAARHLLYAALLKLLVLVITTLEATRSMRHRLDAGGSRLQIRGV